MKIYIYIINYNHMVYSMECDNRAILNKRILYLFVGLIISAMALVVLLGVARSSGVLVALWATGHLSTAAFEGGMSALGLSTAVIATIMNTGKNYFVIMGTSALELFIGRIVLALMGPWGYVILLGILGAAA
jgi:hypothetical protein